MVTISWWYVRVNTNPEGQNIQRAHFSSKIIVDGGLFGFEIDQHETDGKYN